VCVQCALVVVGEWCCCCWCKVECSVCVCVSSSDSVATNFRIEIGYGPWTSCSIVTTWALQVKSGCSLS